MTVMSRGIRGLTPNSSRQCETHGSSGVSFERAMNRSRVPHEIGPRIRVPPEELVRQHVSLHAVTWSAGDDEVARRVRPAAGYRIDVVERRLKHIEVMAAVDAPPPAVSHRGTFEGALGVARTP